MKNKALYFILLLLFLTAGCTTVPTSMEQEAAAGYTPKITEKDLTFNPLTTRVGKVYKDQLENEHISGAAIIDSGIDAFVARAGFARLAEKTIELQTYIYSNDISSRILVSELNKAADRGVKVRILIDDNGTDSDIVDVMLLDLHPNVEVKVFNPFKYRGKLVRYPQFLTDFDRLNSRMHNKLFIVDGIAVVLGGRNVGSNYFYPEKASNFSDTDVLFIGKMARESLKSFNEYWDHHRAVSASLFPSNRTEKRIDKLKKKVAEMKEEYPIEIGKYNSYIDYAGESYENKKQFFYWGEGEIIADDPDKVDMSQKEKLKELSPIVKTLQYLWEHTEKSIDISAAYFVPGKSGSEILSEAEDKGVKVTVVTNSLSSTDAGAVYTKWEKYRKGLLENGIEIYEFMNTGEKPDNKNRKKMPPFTSLHSKTIVFDDKISWIGSFNMDPRSALHNTEIIAVFDNPDFTKELKKVIEGDKKNAWHVILDNGKTKWVGTPPGEEKEVIINHAPNTGFFKRVLNVLMKLIPESLV